MSVRKLGWLFAGLELTALVTVLLLKRFDGLDLEVYLGGARALVDHGSPYDAGVQTTHGILLPFTYTPFAAAVFLPGTVFPFAVTMRLVSIASILAIGVVAYLYVAQLNGALRDRATVKGHVVAASVGIGAQLAGAMLEPVRSTLGFGQINALLMVAVVADALLPGRRRTKGLLIGLAAAVKLLPAVFVLFFLFRKDFKSAGRVVSGFVAATAVMWLAAPRASAKYWTELVFETDRIGGRDYVGNQSLRGLIARFGLPESTQNLVWILAALAVLALTALVTVRSREPALALTACSLCMLLISPISWTHHWVWCAPILVLLGYLCVRHWRDDRQLAYWLGGLTALSAMLFLIGPMWYAVRPANSLFAWLETESYGLLGLLSLVVLGVFAGRILPHSVKPLDSAVEVPVLSVVSSTSRRRTRCSG
jgi:alpha-1,2-mannosyltransferase